LLKRFQNGVTRISSQSKIEIHEFTVEFINENEIYRNCIYLLIDFILSVYVELIFGVFQSFLVK